MAKKFSWSWTALEQFETCPRQYQIYRVQKVIQDTPNEAMLWGQAVHEALEKRLKDGAPLPKGMEKYERYAAKLSAMHGEPLTESKFCINKNFQPVSWFAHDAWCRGIIDAGVVKQYKAVALDWKTGKRKQNSHQLMLFAALMFARFPKLQQVKTGFVWLKEGKTDTAQYYRDDVADIWNEFLPRVKRIETAIESGEFICKPSGLCNGWCGAGREHCEHWRPRRG